MGLPVSFGGMRYTHIAIVAFGIILLLPFHQAVAQMMPTFTNPSSLPIFTGTSWCDPLLGFCQDPYSGVNQSMQQQQSQLQSLQQTYQQTQARESALKSQYGYAAYTSCTANMLNIDSFNFSEVTMYLNANEPCMASYKAKQDAKTQCTTGYVYFNGSCISGDQGCVNKWGANTIWTGTSCDCASGYQWGGSGNNQCVATIQTGCKTDFGPYAYNPPGGRGCLCLPGYEWGTWNQKLGCAPPQNTGQATAIKTSNNSHGSGLAANQIAAILSLLSSFGADRSVIASVQAALGQ